VDAWEVAASANPGVILTMPLATLSEGDASETIMPESREERLTHARRYIAERCIYGVDRNAHAVEMAKLSLWLATFSRGRPFTFLAHALKHGDALVGLTPEQIRAFSWEHQPEDAGPLFANVQADMERAASMRSQLGNISELEFRRKQSAVFEADRLIGRERLAGDLIIAAFFREKTARLRKERLEQYQFAFRQSNREGADQSVAEKLATLNGDEYPIWPFHWPLEFPEVFGRENPGFDAFIGNPPFAGKNTIAASNAEAYPPWLKAIHQRSHGNADLIAHFFRRAFHILRKNGAFGLIATKTIAQGDTRSTGLKWICTHGGEIYSAVKRIVWPGEASRIVSVVSVSKGEFHGQKLIDGSSVPTITAYLFYEGSNEDPFTLNRNQNQSFQGFIPLGTGFVFGKKTKNGKQSSIETMQELIEKNRKNQDMVFPFIGFSEVASHPTHKHLRYVINFGSYDEQHCRSSWPELLEIVEKNVKPDRDKQKDHKAKQNWWLYYRSAIDLSVAIKGLDRVIVAGSQASTHFALTFLPTGMIYSSNLTVIAVQTFAGFAALQSRVHEEWARFFMSTMEDRLAYTPTTCFETFPFPDGWQTLEILEKTGKAYYEYRADLLVKNNQGLTETYNRFHNPDEQSPEIIELRNLHAAMDRVVLDAYGWSNIETNYEFLLDYEIDEDNWSPRKKKPYRLRWPDETRDLVLSQLLALNIEQHKSEVAAKV